MPNSKKEEKILKSINREFGDIQISDKAVNAIATTELDVINQGSVTLQMNKGFRTGVLQLTENLLIIKERRLFKGVLRTPFLLADIEIVDISSGSPMKIIFKNGQELNIISILNRKRWLEYLSEQGVNIKT